jgi:hypothetical protein
MTDPARRLQQLKMLLLAADDALERSRTWLDLVELACQYGRSLQPPLTREELLHPDLTASSLRDVLMDVASAERAVLRA